MENMGFHVTFKGYFQKTVPIRYQGLGNDFQVGGKGKGTATRKLPTPKFKFLLGFRPLYFENDHAKQNELLNIFKVHFFVEVGGRRPSGLNLEG